jgi:hypothetical protein
VLHCVDSGCPGDLGQSFVASRNSPTAATRLCTATGQRRRGLQPRTASLNIPPPAVHQQHLHLCKGIGEQFLLSSRTDNAHRMNASDSTTRQLLNCSFVSSHAQSAMHVVRESMLGVPTPDLLSITRSLQISRLPASLAIDTLFSSSTRRLSRCSSAWICPCDLFSLSPAVSSLGWLCLALKLSLRLN